MVSQWVLLKARLMVQQSVDLLGVSSADRTGDSKGHQMDAATGQK